MSAKRGTPQAWIQHAETELVHAREPKGEALAVKCFSAHQAMEKAVKAVYVSRQIAHPYIHDIKRLLDGLEERGVSVPEAVRGAENMTVLRDGNALSGLRTRFGGGACGGGSHCRRCFGMGEGGDCAGGIQIINGAPPVVPKRRLGMRSAKRRFASDSASGS